MGEGSCVIEFMYDPREETEDEFEARKAEAIAGEPGENITVIVNVIRT